jgi:hypothetical protein
MCKKSTARMPLSCWLRNCDHVGPTRRGAGPIPAECRIRHTVDEARCDVRANQLTLGTPMAPARVLPGHPHHQLSDRRCGRRAPRPPRAVVHLRATSLRCHASNVAGVTANTCAQHRRGSSRDGAANYNRSMLLWRTVPTWRRSPASRGATPTIPRPWTPAVRGSRRPRQATTEPR